jgi:hypothetical protein
VLTPNTFFLRFKSFSSPTMPVFGSDASFLRIPFTFPCLSSYSESKKLLSVTLKISLKTNEINESFKETIILVN